jgi:predicted DCC family thiol-disulfide oxidoreductase YuxK
MTVASARASSPAGGQSLVLYDGVCGLCNRANQFILARDPRGVFDFASLQSQVGRATLVRFHRNPDDMNTFFVVVDYRGGAPVLLAKARAALFVMKALGAPWRWLAVVGVLPDAILDRGYDLLARNRYRLFGRYESCVMPTAEYKRRFIDV